MENILYGFLQVLQPATLLMLLLGVLLGVIVGALPGLNDAITMSILIPLTFGMNPQVAMCMLVGVYVSACYGGSIPAILLRIPGTASAMLTTVDGAPMAKRGETGLALSISTCSSFFGGLFSSVVLMIFSPMLAKMALKFGPSEYLMMALLGLSTITGLAKKGQVSKSFASMALGLIVASIGISPQGGVARMNFKSYSLLSGVSLVPMLVGLFGICSLFELCETMATDKSGDHLGVVEKVKVRLLSKKWIRRLLPTQLRSAAIGSVIGAIPGAGTTMAIFLSYDAAKRAYPQYEFGTGIPEGVAAPETANNAVVASSMVPLVALGVPGNAVSALFLGALTIQGLTAGPMLYKDHPEVAYLLICAFFVGNLFMLPIGIFFCNQMARFILKLDRRLLSVLIVVFCTAGAYAVNNNIFELYTCIVFGLIAYFFNKYKVPIAPFVIADVLGTMIEKNYLQSVIVGGGSFLSVFTRPITLSVAIVTATLLVYPLFREYVLEPRKAKRAAAAGASDAGQSDIQHTGDE